MRRERMGIGPRAMAFAAVLGIAQFALNFNFVYRAEQHITSGLVAVLFALLIVPNTLLGRAFLKPPLEGRFLAGASATSWKGPRVKRLCAGRSALSRVTSIS